MGEAGDPVVNPPAEDTPVQPTEEPQPEPESTPEPTPEPEPVPPPEPVDYQDTSLGGGMLHESPEGTAPE